MFLICVRVWACSKSKQQHFVHVCQEVGAELGFFVLFFSLIQCETKFERKQGRQEKTLSARFSHQREKSLQTENHDTVVEPCPLIFTVWKRTGSGCVLLKHTYLYVHIICLSYFIISGLSYCTGI